MDKKPHWPRSRQIATKPKNEMHGSITNSMDETGLSALNIHQQNKWDKECVFGTDYNAFDGDFFGCV